MTRVAIYARFSSQMQRDASIDDQVRLCRERVAKEGWQVAELFVDRAISGSSMIRSGLQDLLVGAAAGRFDFVVTEALDHLNWDEADVAAICSIRDDGIDPRRTALFIARSLLIGVQDGSRTC